MPTVRRCSAARSAAALTRFVQNWTETVLQAGLIRLVLLDIHRHLGPEDQAYFRQDREKRFGATLEEVVKDREARLPAFRASLDPLRRTVERQDFVSRQGAGLCRLHRVRRVPMGARDQRFRAAGGRRPGARLARPHARPVRRAGAPRPRLWRLRRWTVRVAIATVALILHAWAAVVWVGGMFFALLALRPATAPLEPGPRLDLWSRVLGAVFRLGVRRDRAAAGERLRHDLRGVRRVSPGPACTSTSCRASAS